MSNFTPQVPFATEFDGDKVTMKLGRLKKQALLQLAPIMANGIDNDGQVQMNDEQRTEFVRITGEILPEYVTEFAGLKDADGNIIGLVVVVEQAYFIALASEIMGRLMVISQPTEQESKKSQAGQGVTTKSANSAKTK